MTSAARAGSRRQPRLRRELGLWGAAAVVVGTIIGSGIFLAPAQIAREVGSAPLALAVWVAAAVLTLLGAWCYAELGASLPEAGGDYAYLRRAFGPVWGFLYGWRQAVLSGPASKATYAAAFMLFLSYLVPEVQAPLGAVSVPLPFGGPFVLRFTWAQPLAALVIVVVVGINLMRVRDVGRFQIVLTALKVGAVLAVIGLGLAAPAVAPAAVAPEGPSLTLRTVALAMAPALWSYSGWHTLARMGSEVADPGRTFPRAMAGGILVTAALFLLINVVCFRVLSFGEVAGSEHVGSDALERAAGPGAARWLTIAMIVSVIGSLNASMMASARVPYAMARDGLFFRRANVVLEGTRSPKGSLLIGGGLAIAFVMTGTFAELATFFVAFSWLFYVLGTVALLRLRRLEPGLSRPFRVPGYPVVPVLFILLSGTLTLQLMLADPFRTLVGFGLVLSGLVFYRYWNRRNAGSHTEAAEPAPATG